MPKTNSLVVTRINLQFFSQFVIEFLKFTLLRKYIPPFCFRKLHVIYSFIISSTFFAGGLLATRALFTFSTVVFWQDNLEYFEGIYLSPPQMFKQSKAKSIVNTPGVFTSIFTYINRKCFHVILNSSAMQLCKYDFVLFHNGY